MIKVYDRNMQLLAFLEQAFDIGYRTPFNSLWTANFSMPANDDKNAECKALNFIEVYDEDDYIGMFRIIPTLTQRSADGATITYQCEHVLATLLDDVLFQYHTIGGTEVYTRDVITYVLSKQITPRWQLGICEFEYQFEYTWENGNLLGALFSIPKTFLDEYEWTWDTTSYPWTLNLVRASEEVDAYIVYGVNMKGISKTEDPTELGTRLYCLGYGEGINQLTISDVNNGIPYLDADTQEQYGIICKTFVDRSIENAETLKARGQAMLEQIKIPRYSYSVDPVELYHLTKDPIDKFVSGKKVRVIDEELGIDIIARVVDKGKQNIKGQPGEASLEIANKVLDLADANVDLDNRMRINETHSQGATNIDTHDFADNCDSQHPAKLRFWIPDEAIRINKVLLSFRAEPFRAYSQAIEGGGAYADSVTSESGGASIVTSGDSGIDVVYGWGWTEEADGHSHLFQEVRGHKHHVNIPDHVHIVKIEIPDHIHGIQFGIYEGTEAQSVTVKVDGNTISGLGINEESADILSYLSVDSEGKINRGSWHEITITPNRNSRIVASVVVQQFIQSRGGGSH